MNLPSSLAIVVSGLPASGKSSLGRRLARDLKTRLLDKDDYLENLFDTEGYGEPEQRKRLSRASDELLQNEASRGGPAVLVSHWRPRDEHGDSGTPIDWLPTVFADVIEVYCSCPVETAVQRFRSRRRHPGHLDAERGRAELEQWFRACAAQLPLSLGTLVTVASERQIDYAALRADIDAIVQSRSSV